MITNKKWLGIQFDLEVDLGLQEWLRGYRGIGVDSDGEYIYTQFNEQELDKINDGFNNIKMDLTRIAIEKCLPFSHFINIYTYLELRSIGEKEVAQLINAGFQNPFIIRNIKNEKVFLDNFRNITFPDKIHNLIERDKIMDVFNRIFRFILDRDFEPDQELILSIGLASEENTNTAVFYYLNLSIQLEKIA